MLERLADHDQKGAAHMERVGKDYLEEHGEHSGFEARGDPLFDHNRSSSPLGSTSGRSNLWANRLAHCLFGCLLDVLSMKRTIDRLAVFGSLIGGMLLKHTIGR